MAWLQECKKPFSSSYYPVHTQLLRLGWNSSRYKVKWLWWIDSVTPWSTKTIVEPTRASDRWPSFQHHQHVSESLCWWSRHRSVLSVGNLWNTCDRNLNVVSHVFYQTLWAHRCRSWTWRLCGCVAKGRNRSQEVFLLVLLMRMIYNNTIILK